MYTVRNPLMIIIDMALTFVVILLGYTAYTDEDFTRPYTFSLSQIIVVTTIICVILVLHLWRFGIHEKIVVYVDSIVVYKALGRKKEYKWNEIGMAMTFCEKQSIYGIKLYDRNNKKIIKIRGGYTHREDFINDVRIHHGIVGKY